MRRLLILPLLFVTACGKDSSPTGPTPTPTPTTTKVIRLVGTLNFGSVGLGQTPPDNGFTVNNDGNSVLSVTGISGPCGGSALTVIGSTNFLVAPQQSVSITVRFRPTTVQNCSGNVAVASDATSGTSSIPVTAQGTLDGVPLFSRSGKGNTVFDIPTYISRMRIQGTWDRTQTSNFIVSAAGRSVVNEILRDSITYDGTHLISGSPISITSSNQISWTFTEVR